MKTIISATQPGKERETMWSNEEMLRYAWQAAAALSDVHNVGNIHGSPAIAHTDVDIDQILWIDGMFKVRHGIIGMRNVFVLLLIVNVVDLDRM